MMRFPSSNIVRLRNGAAWALGAAALWACQSREASQAVVQRESVGDTSIVRTVSGALWMDTLTVVEEFRLGQLDGDQRYLFGRISDIAIAPDGSIYVHDSQANELRKYDSTGHFVAVLGRPGQGPGEYNSGGGIVVLSDGRVLMYDSSNHRIVAYSASGDPLETIPLRRGGVGFSGRALFADTSDVLYLRTAVLQTSGIGVNTAFVRLRSDGEVIDTLILPTVSGARDNPGPFDFTEIVAFHPFGGIVQGGTPEYRLDIRWSDGGVQRVERRAVQAPVASEEKSDWEERLQSGGRPIIGLQQNEQGQNVPVYGDIPVVQDRKPWYMRVEVARDGRVWVRRATEAVPVYREADTSTGEQGPRSWVEQNLYDVFARTGEYLGSVLLPERFAPRIIDSEHIWGIQYGALNEAYIVRVRVEGM